MKKHNIVSNLTILTGKSENDIILYNKIAVGGYLDGTQGKLYCLRRKT